MGNANIVTLKVIFSLDPSRFSPIYFQEAGGGGRYNEAEEDVEEDFELDSPMSPERSKKEKETGANVKPEVQKAAPSSVIPLLTPPPPSAKTTRGRRVEEKKGLVSSTSKTTTTTKKG